MCEFTTRHVTVVHILLRLRLLDLPSIIMAVEETPQERRAVYETSSQFHHWRFSEAQLEQSRSSLNKAAVAAIKVAFEAELARPGFTHLVYLPTETW